MSEERAEPTAVERRIYQTLLHLYQEPVTDEDLNAATRIDGPDDFDVIEYENMIPSVKAMNLDHGRYMALKFLWWRLKEENGYYDPWHFQFLVEALEHEILESAGVSYPEKLNSHFKSDPKFMSEVGEVPRLGYSTNQYAVLRACAFVEHYLRDIVDVERHLRNYDDDKITFARLINWATTEDRLRGDTRMLLHFVREVRNNAAHNMWLERNYSLDILTHARECAVYVINDILRELSNEGGQLEEELPTGDRSQELIRHIESEFLWWFDESKHKWSTEFQTDEPDE